MNYKENNKSKQQKKETKSQDKKITKQKNNMTWKKIYQKCNHSKFSQVTNVQKTAKIKSSVVNLLKNYGSIMLIAFLIIIIFLIATFWNNLNILFYTFILMLALCIFAVVYGTYYISLEEDGIKFKINFQETKISYNKLIGIYLTRKKKRFFFIPIYYYAIEITEYVDSEKMLIYSFPTIMLNKKELLKFFESFEVKIFKNEDEEEEKEKEEKKSFYKAIGIVALILLITLLIVSVILWYGKN